MIKLGLLLGIIGKEPQELEALKWRTDVFVRRLEGEDVDLTDEEEARGIKMYDVLLLNTIPEDIDKLENELALEVANVAWAERYEFEIVEDSHE